MNFDRLIDRRGTGCNKWDRMELASGVSPDDGLAMWVADMDFRSPDAINDALGRMVEHGIYGYAKPGDGYLDAIRWWMAERHGWQVEREHIDTTFGVVNAFCICLEAFSGPGEGVVMTSPVYHEFAARTRAAGRRPVQMELPVIDGRYRFDFDSWDRAMTGDERIVVLCSPHNPGGRVWEQQELRGMADFAERHDLILISDEIHHDLVYPGAAHVAMAVACPEIRGRLVTLTSASKTFNVPGLYAGNAIIPDDGLRRAFAARKAALGLGTSIAGMAAAEAAYTPEGAEWVDDLVAYLDGNRRLFDAGIGEIPGLNSMPLQATYLSWVDFSGTGMTPEECHERVGRHARIAASRGSAFGPGGETWLRFNIGTQRSRVEEAVERLQAAFSDLQ